LLYRGCKPLTALSECAFLPDGNQTRLQFGRCAGAIGNDNKGTIFKPAQQGTIGRRAQRPLPVVLLHCGRAWLRRKPLHHFVKRVEGEIDHRAGTDPHVFAQRRQKRLPQRFDGVMSGGDRANGEASVDVSVDNGDDGKIGAQQLHFRADLGHTRGVANDS